MCNAFEQAKFQIGRLINESFSAFSKRAKFKGNSNMAGDPIDLLPYNINNILLYYSNSTKPNQFCLEIILCRIRGAFEYLMYPYYPAYMG